MSEVPLYGEYLPSGENRPTLFQLWYPPPPGSGLDPVWIRYPTCSQDGYGMRIRVVSQQAGSRLYEIVTVIIFKPAQV